MRERLGSIEGRKVVIIGDVLHSRVARSDIWGFTTLGAEVVLCAPPHADPPGIEAAVADGLRRRQWGSGAQGGRPGEVYDLDKPARRRTC